MLARPFFPVSASLICVCVDYNMILTPIIVFYKVTIILQLDNQYIHRNLHALDEIPWKDLMT